MTAGRVLTEYPGRAPGAAVTLLDMIEATAYDELTGTLRLPGWTARAERDLAARSPGSRAAVLVIDVDGFRTWNDMVGHPAADRVLAEVVGAIRRGLCHVDVIGRLGGDEFAVVLADDHALLQAAGVAECLRRRVEALRVHIPARLLAEHPPGETGRNVDGVTVSIGAATPRPGTAPDLSTLVVAADAALYAAKAAGRNTVRAVETCTSHGPGTPITPSPVSNASSVSGVDDRGESS